MEAPKLPSKPFLEVVSDSFSTLTDPRVLYKITYSIEEVLFLVYCSSVCNMDSYEEIQDFGEDRLDWLRKYLPYKQGIPSHDTINRVMGLLNTKELEKMLVDIANYEICLPNGSIVNIDGKWLGRSATVKEQQTKKSDGGKQASIMVNAYSAMYNSCIASVEVGDKSGEKQAVSGLLSLLDLSGCILTMDAGYCYKDTAQEIISCKADYLIGLKDNQPLLVEFARNQFKEDFRSSEFETTDKGHGREERRIYSVLNINDMPLLSASEYRAIEGWQGLRSLIQVESWVHDTVKDKKYQERRLYISSCAIDASKAENIVRGHWRIENSLHWILDVCLGEDSSTKRSRNSAVNFSIFRKLGLNKLQAWNPKEGKKISIKRKQNKCMASTENLKNALGFF